MSAMDFERMLAQYHENLKTQYDDAEEFSDWMPDDGEYITIVTSLKKGAKVISGQEKPMIWWRLVGQIDDVANEAIHGREYLINFYKSTVWGIVKSHARALNMGKAVNSQEEADAVFEAAVGKILRVEVYTSTSQKDGKDYTNCRIKEVIDAPEATSADELPVATEATEQPA